MRKHLVLFIIGILFVSASIAQQPGVAINTSGMQADGSAMLDISSNNKGVLVPRLNSLQRIAISQPASGLLVYDTDFNQFWYFDGSQWMPVIGLAGSTGPTGPQGLQGTQGNTGPQGIQGAQGNTGANGATGAVGAQGIQGNTGAIGQQGIQGLQGNAGPAGPQGLQGTQGNTGPQGIQGAQGNTGANGATGAIGAQGIQGNTGAIGQQGIQGNAGATGPTGPHPTTPAQATSLNVWSILGNSGTNPSSHFLGTTDNQSLVFRTNNTQRMRLQNNGQIIVNNTAAPLTGDVFSVYAGSTDAAVNAYATGSGEGVYAQNTGTGDAIAGLTNTTGAGVFAAVVSPGSGNAFLGTNNGTGDVASFYNLNAASNNMVLFATTNSTATGRAVEFISSSTTNTDVTLFSVHDGNGRAGNFQSSLTTGTQPTLFASSQSTSTLLSSSAVWGQTSGIAGGVFLGSLQNNSTLGITGQYNGGGNFDGTGVYGRSTPNAFYGYGVVGEGNWYSVFAIGDMGASGLKPFVIDHPADPENKFLRHFSIESDEVLNLYRGTVTLDSDGKAQVILPDYVQLINTDFSYSLTPVGGNACLYISREFDGSSFEIAGGAPGIKASYVIYGHRNDPYVQQNPERLIVELPKKANQKGSYIHPNLYQQPEERGLFYNLRRTPLGEHSSRKTQREIRQLRLR